MSINTLTEFEVMGMQSEFNFADGHAYHDLSVSQQSIIQRLPSIWQSATSSSVKEAEESYLFAFKQLAKAPVLANYPHYKISPTASNSIDIVGAWLEQKGMMTYLLEPTFDNLYLILKRRGVKLLPLNEAMLHAYPVSGLVSLKNGAIFLVNPNNPTGRVLSKEKFIELINYCLKNNCVLILDNTFRFFVDCDYDQYQLLIDAGVTFIAIEDTGKVWPTQELKASLIFYSKNIAREIELIYEEIYLCASKFTLGLLSAILQDSYQHGLPNAVWREVADRRAIFRDAIKHSCLSINSAALRSNISVEWVDIDSMFVDDYAVMRYLQDSKISILPGRHFYWSSPALASHTRQLRFSLLKPKTIFLSGMQQLKQSLKLLQVSDRAINL